MLDRGDSRSYCGDDPFGAMRMGCDLETMTARLLHNHSQFFFGVLLGADWPFEGQHPRSGAGLDHFGAVFDLVAHCSQDRLGPIRDPVFRSELQNARRKPGHVTMAACDAERITGGDDPWSFNQTSVDRTHQ